MRAYPTLENFFAGYFHQDWAAEHDAPEAVVAYYRDSENPDQVSHARAEAEALLGEQLDEAALGARITALGCEYDPTRDGATWRGWLQRLAQDLGEGRSAD
ncbi:contact-dependent growth inhibition system immunity protein [Luteimonas sp. FCS-9]|uniref:contact-dependent growth inhibition system immunity protein n=1 Tax=Luteimonas sp. FCS-9 TaxID=1547516 RepID=UPI00069AEC6E|nr:contact-dependent growth inhibition system immunity protein [Luteimonas sp. FCS-9]